MSGLFNELLLPIIIGWFYKEVEILNKGVKAFRWQQTVPLSIRINHDFTSKQLQNQKKFIKCLVEQKECSTFAPHLRENAAANEIAKEVWVSG